MKKLIFILTVMAAMIGGSDVYGQQLTAPPQGEFRLGVFVKSDSSLSVVNTTAESDTFTLGAKAAHSNVIITATVLKKSGTIGGSAKLYGSTTGSYWEPIVATADTMSISNSVSTTQGYSWEFGPATPKYRRYKVVYQQYTTGRFTFCTRIEYY